MRRMVLMVLLACATASSAGQPTHRRMYDELLDADPHPLLVQARGFDPFLLGKDGNREKAVALYERFLRENPESELAPVVFWRLGHLFADRTPPGEKRDPDKAREYFGEAHRLLPTEWVSPMTIHAWVSYVSLFPTVRQRVEGDIEIYTWLASLTAEDLDKRGLYGQRAQLSEEQLNLAVARLGKTVENARRVTAVNMVAAAVEDAKQDKTGELLLLIVTRLPDTPPGIEAAKALRTLSEKVLREESESIGRKLGQDSSSISVPPVGRTQAEGHGWMPAAAWAGVGLLVLVLAAGVVIYATRQRRSAERGGPRVRR